MGLNMGPAFSIEYSPQLATGYLKFLHEYINSSRLMSLPHFLDIPFGQMRIVMAHSVAMAFLGISVLHIFFMSSKKQMVRTNAIARIASMQYGKPVRDVSISQYPCKPMRGPILFHATNLFRYLSISIAGGCPSPQPASFSVFSPGSKFFKSRRAGNATFIGTKCQIAISNLMRHSSENDTAAIASVLSHAFVIPHHGGVIQQ